MRFCVKVVLFVSDDHAHIVFVMWDLGLSFSILKFENGWGFRYSSPRSVPRLYRLRNWAFMCLTHE